MKKFLWFIFFLIITFLVLSYYQFNKFIDFLLPNTQETPIKITKMSMSSKELLEKRREFSNFVKSLESGTCKEYALVGEDVNVLIRNVDKDITLTKWVYANIKDSNFDIEFSVPLDSVNSSPKKFKGRFLNGKVNGSLIFNSQRPNVIDFKINSLVFADKEKKLNIKNFKGVNLRKIYAQYPKARKAFYNISKIGIKDDRLIIECKTSDSNGNSSNASKNASKNDINNNVLKKDARGNVILEKIV
ncbi:MAG: hypothetical protein ACOX3T_02310 [Bdellovibrionota bacterium]